ncbi:hypothetical protein ACFQ51_15385 [Streptomyces kaempferi]
MLRIPEAISSFRRGSRASNEAGKGTRSRRVTTMSKSASAAASASSSARCSRNPATSTSSATGDQSTTSVATPW